MCGCAAVIVVISLAGLSGTPSLEDTIRIREWYFCGPFSMGARESVIAADPTIENDPFYRPDTTKKYISILAPGGTVRWQKLMSGSGEIEIDYEYIPWDTIQDYYGVAGVVCGTYIYG